MSTNCSDDSQTMQENVTEHLGRRERLSLWVATLAGQRLQHDNQAHIKNREAEERHARKHVWGYDEPAGGDDMAGDTFLGDIAVTQQPAAPQSRGLSPLLAAALGAALPGVGIGGFLASQILNPADPAPVVEGVDTSVKIGLGKIGDFLPDQPGQ